MASKRDHLSTPRLRPRDHQKTALFQLAATVSLLVLADLLGFTPNAAVRRASLNCRFWSVYISPR